MCCVTVQKCSQQVWNLRDARLCRDETKAHVIPGQCTLIAASSRRVGVISKDETLVLKGAAALTGADVTCLSNDLLLSLL